MRRFAAFLAITLAGLRAAGASGDVFKDVCHLYVGGLFGAAVVNNRWYHWVMAVGMSVVEGVVFYYTRG